MMGETFVSQYKKMSKLIKKSPYFTIVAGDFNHVSGSQEYEMIKKTGLYDVSAAYGVYPSKTPTFHVNLDSEIEGSNRMIDFIFVNRAVEVKDFSIVFDEPSEYVSDHSLVYAEFEVKE